MDAQINKQAGIEKLSEFGYYYETDTITEFCKAHGETVLTIDDLLVTEYLISKKINANFERTRHEIKMKQNK